MLKKALYAILGLVALFLVVALFLPGRYSVERSIEIARPPAVVFGQISDFHRWLEWNPFTETEPSANNTITGAQGAPGATWEWAGEEIGVGSMTVREIERDRSLRSTLLFKEPMEGEADDLWTLEPTASGTRVTWSNQGDVPYPIGRYLRTSIESMLGELFDKGLANLKRVCESLPEPETPPVSTSGS
jgi:hypothetical protein